MDSGWCSMGRARGLVEWKGELKAVRDDDPSEGAGRNWRCFLWVFSLVASAGYVACFVRILDIGAECRMCSPSTAVSTQTRRRGEQKGDTNGFVRAAGGKIWIEYKSSSVMTGMQRRRGRSIQFLPPLEPTGMWTAKSKQVGRATSLPVAAAGFPCPQRCTAAQPATHFPARGTQQTSSWPAARQSPDCVWTTKKVCPPVSTRSIIRTLRQSHPACARNMPSHLAPP